MQREAAPSGAAESRTGRSELAGSGDPTGVTSRVTGVREQGVQVAWRKTIQFFLPSCHFRWRHRDRINQRRPSQRPSCALNGVRGKLAWFVGHLFGSSLRGCFGELLQGLECLRRSQRATGDVRPCGGYGALSAERRRGSSARAKRLAARPGEAKVSRPYRLTAGEASAAKNRVIPWPEQRREPSV